MTQATQTIQKQIADLFEQARVGVRLKKAGSPPQCAVQTKPIGIKGLEARARIALGENAVVNLGGMPLKVAEQMIGELERLIKKYPEARRWFKNLSVEKRKVINLLGEYSAKNKKVLLNAYYYKPDMNVAKFLKEAAEQTASGFTASPKLAGTMTHEFGHSVFWNLNNAQMTAIEKRFVVAKSRIAKEVSRYGARDHHEFFAEMFTKIEEGTANQWLRDFWIKDLGLKI